MPSKCAYCGEEYEGSWSEHAETCKWLKKPTKMPLKGVEFMPIPDICSYLLVRVRNLKDEAKRELRGK